ncbi:MAG: GvpD gas vesicle, partial [Methanosarcinales archaeon]|nr:GvpD gas vesicle [Methanosarcinales archaeon]
MNIPSEICRFFSIEEGQTLLIKGLPGTGKTTLAFEIMNALCEEKNGMYISTRVDPKRLFATFPWMKETIPPKNVINATQAKLTSSLREWMDLEEGAATYDSVLGFFKLLFDEAEETENPMIVIDSWDAVMNYTAHIIGGARQSFEQNMCEFARDLGIHLIFVSEFADLMPLDYIVDGVVTMERIKLLGAGDAQGISSGMRARYAREIRLDKLRGVEIRQHSYTCTLHKGRFRYFEPYQEQGETRIGRGGNRIPDPADGCISTGILDLDHIITPLKYGSCNVMEIDQGVGKRYYQILTALASNALKNGRGVFLLPSI